MTTTPLERRLTDLITPLLAAEGYDLVQVKVLGQGRGTTIEILAENPATHTLDLDSCARLSRTVGTHLEVEDVMDGPYHLQVSSPGIDRPLTQPAHFKRYQGFEVKIETVLPVGDQRRFHGRITSADDECVTITTDTKIVTLDYGQIDQAKLKLTDELMTALRPANLNTTTTDQPGEAKK